MGMLGTAGRIVRRWTVWGRLLIAGEAVLQIKKHYDLLEESEKKELRTLLRKSKGRPGNLSKRERSRISNLVEKAEFGDYVRDTAATMMPVPVPGLKSKKKK